MVRQRELEQFRALQRSFPLTSDLRCRARRRIPRFIFDFLEGGVDGEKALYRNRSALDAVEITPRYGRSADQADTSVELFGRRYSMPLGIAPTGFDGAVWPGATRFLAQAAQASNIPYVVSLMASADMETVVRLAPDVAWLQLFPFPGRNHAITQKLVERARTAGINVLVLTMDVPVRPKRPRDLRNGLRRPLASNPHLLLRALLAPAWLSGLARHGLPDFANLVPYAEGVPTHRFVHEELGGGFSWDIIARIRDAWQKPLLVKGILDPRDAQRAAELGLDGIVVSNHGGRQFDAAPASIDVLPAIREAAGAKLTLLLDSGIESGLDILRATVMGADGVLAGRAFLYGLAALGGQGAQYVVSLLREELDLAMRQAGLDRLADSRELLVPRSAHGPT